MSEAREVEAWLELGMVVMVVRMDDGSYYECGWDLDELERHGFGFVPEGC